MTARMKNGVASWVGSGRFMTSTDRAGDARAPLCSDAFVAKRDERPWKCEIGEDECESCSVSLQPNSARKLTGHDGIAPCDGKINRAVSRILAQCSTIPGYLRRTGPESGHLSAQTLGQYRCIERRSASAHQEHIQPDEEADAEQRCQKIRYRPLSAPTALGGCPVMP